MCPIFFVCFKQTMHFVNVTSIGQTPGSGSVMVRDCFAALEQDWDEFPRTMNLAEWLMENVTLWP